jgi:hypothetical protein
MFNDCYTIDCQRLTLTSGDIEVKSISQRELLPGVC